MGLLLPGHFGSERFAQVVLAEMLAAEFAELEVWASRRDVFDRMDWLLRMAGSRHETPPTTYDLRPTIYDLRSTTYDLRPTIYDLRSTIYDLPGNAMENNAKQIRRENAHRAHRLRRARGVAPFGPRFVARHDGPLLPVGRLVLAIEGNPRPRCLRRAARADRPRRCLLAPIAAIFGRPGGLARSGGVPGEPACVELRRVVEAVLFEQRDLLAAGRRSGDRRPSARALVPRGPAEADRGEPGAQRGEAWLRRPPAADYDCRRARAAAMESTPGLGRLPRARQRPRHRPPLSRRDLPARQTAAGPRRTDRAWDWQS